MQKLTQKDDRAQFKSLNYKALREKHGSEMLCDLRLGNGFLGMTPNWLPVQPVIEKMDQQEFNKTTKLCTSKDTIKRVNIQSTEKYKIFGNHIVDKIFA